VQNHARLLGHTLAAILVTRSRLVSHEEDAAKKDFCLLI
jgi:hypothetical protein